MKAIMTVVKKIFPIILIVGLIGWAFGITYTGLSIIHQNTINYGTYTWTYYEFDVKTYLQSVEHSITDASLVNVIPKTPTLPNKPNWTDVLSVLKWAFNSFFVFVFNMIIYAINWVILAPIKLILYPANIFYAIFGLNTANSNYVQAMQMLYGLEIPLINPI